MLNALRASVMILVLVGTAHAGEILVPPAPRPAPNMAAEPAEETFYAETGPPEVSDSLATAALDLLALLTTLL